MAATYRKKVKEGVWGHRPPEATKCQRIKTPYGPLSYGIKCEKDFNVDLRKDQNIHINMVLVVVD